MLLEALGAGLAVGTLGVGVYAILVAFRPRAPLYVLDREIEASGAGFVRVDLSPDHPWLLEVPRVVSAVWPSSGIAGSVRRAGMKIGLNALRWALPGRARFVLGLRGGADLWVSFARAPPGPRPRFANRGPNKGEWLGPSTARVTLPTQEPSTDALAPVGREICASIGEGALFCAVFPPQPDQVHLAAASREIRLWGVELEGDADHLVLRVTAWPTPTADPDRVREDLQLAWDRLRDASQLEGVEMRFEPVHGRAPFRASLTVSRPPGGWEVAVGPFVAAVTVPQRQVNAQAGLF